MTLARQTSGVKSKTSPSHRIGPVSLLHSSTSNSHIEMVQVTYGNLESSSTPENPVINAQGTDFITTYGGETAGMSLPCLGTGKTVLTASF